MGHRTTGSARCLPAALLSLTFLVVAPVRADLMNPDFNGTFVPWQGFAAFEDLDTGALGDADIPDPGTRPDLFVLESPGRARLSTSTDGSTGALGTDWFLVALGQFFDVPADAATIAFDYAWSLTTGGQDEVAIAMLYDPGGGVIETLDLLPGVDRTQQTASGRIENVDIRSWAGRQDALFDVFLADGDFIVGDTLTIGNIVIAPAATPVPAPPTLVLVALGALVLRFSGRRARA